MLQRYAAATYVGRMCPATIGDKIRGKTRHSGTYRYTKGRSWGACIYINIYIYIFIFYLMVSPTNMWTRI